MPPKAKITREMIIDAAYEIVRESGEENINARNIAQKLGCSTQPVLYVFKTIDEIRECVYQKADEYHSEYLMQVNESEKNPMVVIWKNYIRFSVNERNDLLGKDIVVNDEELPDGFECEYLEGTPKYFAARRVAAENK